MFLESYVCIFIIVLVLVLIAVVLSKKEGMIKSLHCVVAAVL
jgi:hypothetical protein